MPAIMIIRFYILLQILNTKYIKPIKSALYISEEKSGMFSRLCWHLRVLRTDPKLTFHIEYRYAAEYALIRQAGIWYGYHNPVDPIYPFLLALPVKHSWDKIHWDFPTLFVHLIECIYELLSVFTLSYLTI